jgi:short-subunit dehydrogenase
VADTALITGASGGIGEELARVFAEHHHDLVLVARSEDKLRSLSDELSRAHGVHVTVLAADLSDAGAPLQLFETLRAKGVTIAVLVNNAGSGARGEFARLDAQVQSRMIQLNVVALTELARLFLPGMLERGHGGILNVASTAAYVPGPRMAVYYASKAFVLSLSEALSEETQGTGVTVTALCPGPTRTNFAAVAGNEDSRLFRSGSVMDARSVAELGYAGLMAGKRVVVAGLSNRLTVFSTRLAPRTLLAKITARLN